MDRTYARAAADGKAGRGAERRTRAQLDPGWWTACSFEDRPLREVLRGRDVGAVFRFLKTRGWSRSGIAAATGMSESRVRQVALGRQRVTSYEVLERVAEGLRIERGLMGLAYSDEPASGSEN